MKTNNVAIIFELNYAGRLDEIAGQMDVWIKNTTFNMFAINDYLSRIQKASDSKAHLLFNLTIFENDRLTPSLLDTILEHQGDEFALLEILIIGREVTSEENKSLYEFGFSRSGNNENVWKLDSGEQENEEDRI